MGKIERSYTKRSSSLPKREKHSWTSYMCMKFLTEKTITSKNYNLSIMMIDMPKAFDKVNRKTLFEKLEAILDESEMRMMYLLINNFKVKVRVGRSLREEILTNIGIAQGECFSPFFLYSIGLNLWM